MTAVSKTLTVNTAGLWESVATLADITITSGKTYSMQIQNLAYLKIADAEFTIYSDAPFTYKASDDDLYIKTDYSKCELTILENAE